MQTEGLVLGLDLGIASVGWALLNFKDRRIEDLGVRIFDKAENPKTGESLALPRRMARLARRRLRRKRLRLKLTVRLFQKYGLISTKEWRETNGQKGWSKDPYTLRTEGLDAILSGPDFARALYHIVKLRGFKSNKRGGATPEEKNSDEGKLLAGVKEMQERLKAEGFRTIGEMLTKSDKFAAKKRNDPGSYKHTPARDDLEAEIHALFEAQRKHGNSLASIEFENALVERFKWQAPPESGDKLLAKVGKCSLFTDEKRAPLACPTYELYVLVSKLVNLRIQSATETVMLNTDQINALVAFAKEKSAVTYAQIRKTLSLTDDDRFLGLDYRSKKGFDATENAKEAEKKSLFKWRFYNELKKTLVDSSGEKTWALLDSDLTKLDRIAEILTIYKTQAEVEHHLLEIGLSHQDIIHLSQLAPEGFGSLSLVAAKKLLPLMLHGFRYDEACKKLDLHHSKLEKATKNLLPPIDSESIMNPVVIRSFSQARKVVNAIIRKYGLPSAIHVESARDLQKPFDERKTQERENEKRHQEKESKRAEFKEAFGSDPIKDHLLKWRLYKEQNGRCLYSDTPLDLNRLFDPGYCEVDHILPFSRSFEDGYLNKALVTGAMNREKGNRTPFEFIGKKDPESQGWHEFKIRTQQCAAIPWKKRQKLLNQEFSNPNREQEFRDRNLNDTRYATRLFANHIKHHLDVTVAQPAGQLTSFLRYRWGLNKNRTESHLHHAQDAAVIAAATQGMIQRAARYNQWKELGKPLTGFVLDEDTGELVDKHFPRPWERFDIELKERQIQDKNDFLSAMEGLGYSSDFRAKLNPIFVSFAPDHSMSGAAHKETIVSQASIRDNTTWKKIPLTEIKLNSDGNIPLADRENNQQLHDALLRKLNEFEGNAEKAFKNPFYKPTRNGKLGPLVRSITIESNRVEKSLIPVRKGLAARGDMVRLDVYHADNKFFLVPIYVSDVASGVLPISAISSKPYEKWPKMNPENFLFSLQKNDYVVCTSKNKEVLEGYYRSCDRDSGRIEFRMHWKVYANGEKNERVGTLNLSDFEKYSVDPLGNKARVSKESLRPLRNSHRKT
jgi:CRISPR-associated endonuclease Csn1